MVITESKSVLTRTICAIVSIASSLLLVGITPDMALAQESNSQNITGNIGFDLSQAYFFRGIKQEREGLIAQPYGDLSFALWRNDQSPIHSIDFKLGTWNSLHSGPTGFQGAEHGTHEQAWYESDFYAGFSMGFDNWEAGFIYTSYMSPNSSFATITEMAFSLGMDDRAIFGAFSMQPHVAIAIEIEGQADGGTSEGVYLEVGVEPEVDIIDEAASISFPITIGLSMSNYYENLELGLESTFGYFDIGADISFPLTFSPAGYGDWELSGGFHLVSLGEYLKSLNNGDSAQPVATVGVNLSF